MSTMSHEQHASAGHTHHYRALLLMSVLSFLAMFGLMYAMVDVFANVYANLNQFYMVGLMVAPMVLIELVLMRRMYPNRTANALIAGAALALMGCSWIGIRQQVGIGDHQFLASMIPHHASAILMCEQAKVSDPRVKALCGEIQSSQRREIAQMKSLLAEKRAQ